MLFKCENFTAIGSRDNVQYPLISRNFFSHPVITDSRYIWTLNCGIKGVPNKWELTVLLSLANHFELNFGEKYMHFYSCFNFSK